ncbi:MAG: energy-coupling factor transporter transmembrane component T family protein [Ktedonobacterales bacterium]
MLNNLPVGIYIPGQTPVHRLRARTKLLVLIWMALLCFLANHRTFHYGAYIAAFSLIGLGLLLAQVNLHYIWKRMRLLVILLLIGIPFSLMFTPGSTWHTFGPLMLHFDQLLGLRDVSLALGPVVVTYDGIWFVISFGAIFLLLYLGSLTLTLTTTPVALAEGIMLLLRPLRRLGLPVEEFGLMTMVSLRFIPVLIQEAEQLMNAQISRGADFTTGSIGARIRRLGSLLVPLIQGALRRAGNLSSALEARGYGTTGQATLLHEGPLRLADWAVLLGVPLITGLAYWKLL